MPEERKTPAQPRPKPEAPKPRPSPDDFPMKQPDPTKKRYTSMSTRM